MCALSVIDVTLNISRQVWERFDAKTRNHLYGCQRYGVERVCASSCDFVLTHSCTNLDFAAEANVGYNLTTWRVSEPRAGTLPTHVTFRYGSRCPEMLEFHARVGAILSSAREWASRVS